MDTMLLLAVGAIAVAAVVLYIMDRYSKTEPIVWADAAKVAVAGSLLTGGVLFATTSEVGATVVEAVKTHTQDMFVGKPSF